MSYDYIRRMYGVDPIPGHLVQHQVTGRYGTIHPEPAEQQHYVHVCFQGDKHTRPCHPAELDYETAQSPYVPAERSAMERRARKAGA
ncbi:MAG: hypothetical protein ACOH2J_18265 [Allorhizobium sp.]